MIQKIKLLCPFCDKEINTLFEPEGFMIKKSHADGRTKSQYLHKKEKYEPLEDCPHCGKSKREIKKALEGDMPTKPKPKEEVRKQLEELGLLDRFEGKGGGEL